MCNLVKSPSQVFLSAMFARLQLSMPYRSSVMLKILMVYFVFEKRSLMSGKTFANNIEIRQTLLTRYPSNFIHCK